MSEKNVKRFLLVAMAGLLIYILGQFTGNRKEPEAPAPTETPYVNLIDHSGVSGSKTGNGIDQTGKEDQTITAGQKENGQDQSGTEEDPKTLGEMTNDKQFDGTTKWVQGSGTDEPITKEFYGKSYNGNMLLAKNDAYEYGNHTSGVYKVEEIISGSGECIGFRVIFQ